MRKDVIMLEKYNLMDYSLLMCIQENPEYVNVLRETRSDANSSRDSGALMMRKMTSVSSDSDLIKTVRDRFVGSRHKFLSVCGKYIYHIGIIDYLQDYNMDKKLENLLKYHILMKGGGISAVPPPKYAERFIQFMRSSVIID